MNLYLNQLEANLILLQVAQQSFTRSLNASYLEMDGQSSVDWMQSKEFASFFSPLTLHAVNLLLSKKILPLTLLKIMTVSRPSTILRVFLMGKLGCPTKEGNWGVFLKVQKFKFSPSVGYHPYQKTESPCPSSDHRPHICWKKRYL